MCACLHVSLCLCVSVSLCLYISLCLCVSVSLVSLSSMSVCARRVRASVRMVCVVCVCACGGNLSDDVPFHMRRKQGGCNVCFAEVIFKEHTGIDL
jgi:hypothetical protein